MAILLPYTTNLKLLLDASDLIAHADGDAISAQTGAGGAGAAAATYRYRVPSTAKRYVGVKATGSASGDSSGKSYTLEAVV